MFQVQLMLETKDKEIERLQNYNIAKDQALDCSEKMLEADTKIFLEFFQNIKTESVNASNKLEELKKTKMERNAQKRKIDDNCNTIKSSINKQIETLTGLCEYQEFFHKVAKADK